MPGASWYDVIRESPMHDISELVERNFCILILVGKEKSIDPRVCIVIPMLEPLILGCTEQGGNVNSGYESVISTQIMVKQAECVTNRSFGKYAMVGAQGQRVRVKMHHNGLARGDVEGN